MQSFDTLFAVVLNDIFLLFQCPTERTALREGHVTRPSYRSTQPRAQRDSSADSNSSMSDTGMAPSTRARAGRLSACEAQLLWQEETRQMTISLQRLVLRSFKHKKADLVLRVNVHHIPPPPSETSSEAEVTPEGTHEPLTPEREVCTIGIVGKKEQLFRDKVQVDMPGGLSDNVLKFRVYDRRAWENEDSDALLEGQVALDDLNAETENFVCVIMRPRPPSPVSTKATHNGPLTRYVKLRVAHAPGMPGTISPAADFKGNR